jgi:type I restriction enzyme S subunit
MNAERLLAHFERISEAPDAIARLRRFILDLAVRGKLVEQDPEDESADDLLKEIQARFRRLRIAKMLVPLETKEIPFALPGRWRWTRLGVICEKTGSGSTPRGGKEAYSETGIPFLRSQNIYNDGLRLADVVFIDTKTHGRMAGTRVLPCDLLLNITGGSIGRCAKVPVDFEEANVSQHVAILRVGLPGVEDFLHVLVLSPYFQSFVDDSQTGAGRGGLPKNRMDAIPIPLPPLAEQRRIVAKVDELMALCDQLEAARQQRQQCRGRLVAASLQRLNQPAADPVSFRNDASFALQVLPSHTTTPAQIKQLRQTILNLAVQGKLVEQSPEDEPAISWLLQRVEGNHSRRSRKTVATSVEGCQDSSISVLPETWLWVVLDDLVLVMDSGWSPQCEDHPRSSIESWGVLKTTAVQSLFFDERYHKELPSNLQPRPQHEAREGDILITRAGPKNRVGISCVIDKIEPRLMISDKIIRLRLAVGLSPCFVALALNAGRSSEAVEDAKSGMAVMQMNISQVKLRAVPIPLPPLAEQHRIVAMVDELMALCDQLEQQLSQADQQRRRLLEAVLAEALGGRLPTEQEDSHAAIA